MSVGPDLSGLRFSAIVFDCGGTLADTTQAHYRVFRAALAGRGLDPPRPGTSRVRAYRAAC